MIRHPKGFNGACHGQQIELRQQEEGDATRPAAVFALALLFHQEVRVIGRYGGAAFRRDLRIHVTTNLQADYVIAGSGAVGMAFADIILTESNATVIIIDRYAKPGGHWNVAYPFVTLHQPASFYGVSSAELSGGRLEQGGLNDGLAEMSSGAAVSAYFDDVMRHQFLPTGRVQYFPLHSYEGDGNFVSHITGERFHATATKKFVDATYLKTSVPATHTPNFTIDDGVRFMPLNDLPNVDESTDGFVVIGAGKTGIDACLWLLQHNVDADNITWIVSRDAWLLDRKNTQMSEPFFDDTLGAQAGMLEGIAEANSPGDMFEKLEECGYFLRIDRDVEPQMFHGATISALEVEALQRIKNVVRLGHVTAIHSDEIELVRGTIPTTPQTIHVDCSASAIPSLRMKPIFAGDVITPQLVRPYQPVFSAAMIAHVDLNYETEEEKNTLCAVVAVPNTLEDFVDFTATALLNQYAWSQDKPLQRWIANNRLDGASKLIQTIGPGDSDKMALLNRIRTAAPNAAMKLLEFQALNDRSVQG